MTFTPSTIKKGRITLKRGWTHIIARKIADITTCVVNFRYSKARMNNNGSISVSGNGYCKHSNCSSNQIKFCVNVLGKEDVDLHITQKGPVCHGGEAQKHQLTGPLRKTVGDELKEKGVTQYYYQKLDASEELTRAGNITEPQSQDVLRKCLSEVRKGEAIHYNLLIEFITMENIFKIVDRESKIIPGYIQHLYINSFTVHMYSEQQLRIYAQELKTGRCIVHLDATGTCT